VLIYTTFAIVLIMLFCMLGVDWGRVSVVKAELKTAADAAVRAGGTRMLEGGDIASVLAAANQIITRNVVDGSNAKARVGSVRVGVYIASTKQFFVTNDPLIANAVSVTLEHRFNEDSIPLTFARIFTGQDTIVRTESLVMLSDVPGSFDVRKFTTNTPGTSSSTPPTSTSKTTYVEAKTNTSNNNSTNTSNSNSNNAPSTNTKSSTNASSNTTTSTNTNTSTTVRTTPASTSNSGRIVTTTSKRTQTPPTRTANTTKSSSSATKATPGTTSKTNSNNTSNTGKNSSTASGNNSKSSGTTAASTPGSSTSTPASSSSVTVTTQTPGSGRRLVTIK